MHTLEEYRREIDAVDKNILILLAKRTNLARQIGKLKKRLEMPIVDTKRESAKLERLTAQAAPLGLGSTFVESLWRRIFKETYTIQKE